ncbi:MAG: lipoprotein-releasing ABC transporter permease subunit [Caulobacterales bacterium]|nr:lipoprotein-releasing ABC transporter permease subunit [Caulobacterales bacterium]
MALPFSLWERAVSIRYLRARRKDSGVALIAIICFVAVAFAVFAQITVMSVMTGFRSELLDRMLGFSGHAYIAGSALTDDGRDATVKRLLTVPGVVRVVPLVEAQAMVLGPNQIAGAIVRGVSPSDLKGIDIVARNIRPGGSLNGFGQGDEGGDLIVIGDRMAQVLGVRPGDTVTLVSPDGAMTAFGSSVNQKDYIVAATFSIGMSEIDQSFIYMPLKQAQLFFGRNQSVDSIEIMLDDPDQATLVKPQLAAAAGPGALVTDWTDKNRSFFEALKLERFMVRIIMMIVGVMAALNIVSCIVMLVKSKGRDIGILRSMGASQSSILRVFMMSGITLGLAGCAAGLVAGVLFCLNIEHIQRFIEWVTGVNVFSADVYYLSHLPAKLDWGEVAIVTGWSFLLSVMATLVPAWRASRMDPVEALRYE